MDTTSPCAARRAGRARRARAATAKTLTAQTGRPGSAAGSSTVPPSSTPAEWISTSSRSGRGGSEAPVRSATRSATYGSAEGSVATTASTASASRPPTRMWWVRPSSVAMAAPMPREAPVTRAIGRVDSVLAMLRPYADRRRRARSGAAQHPQSGGNRQRRDRRHEDHQHRHQRPDDQGDADEQHRERQADVGDEEDGSEHLSTSFRGGEGRGGGDGRAELQPDPGAGDHAADDEQSQ